MGFDIVIFALIAAFATISGINDGGNLMSTFLASRTLRPVIFIPLLILSVGLGPVVFGTAVSRTISVQIVNFSAAGHTVLMVSLLAALFTLSLTWWLKIPTSTTIALGGGMVGASVISGRSDLIHWMGVAKLLVGLVASVCIGFIVACVVTKLLWFVLKRLSMKQVSWLQRAQYVTALWQGLAYGANDQEKVVGLLTVLWMLVQHQTRYHVPFVAIVLALLFWTTGLLFGSLRIARTVGQHIVRIDPTNALATQLSAALTVSSAALSGLPVSTTQTTDGSLFGAATILRPLNIRWNTISKMAGVWAVTMPLAVVFGVIVMESAVLIH